MTDRKNPPADALTRLIPAANAERAETGRPPLTPEVWTIPAKYGRTIRYAYKANLGNADFQATADLILSVRSSTTFRTNKRFFHNGQTVKFSGALRSKPVPAGGVLIDLQAKAGTRWITFKTTRTKRTGRWSSKYRFHATTGLQTYAFRVRVRQDSGYPYGISTSKAVKVRVRG